MIPKHPPGPPMTLGNMREQGGVHHLIALLAQRRVPEAGGLVLFTLAARYFSQRHKPP